MIGAPASLLLVFLLAAAMETHEYAGYVAATAILETGIVLGTCGLDWMAQTAIPTIRLQGTATQLRRAIHVLTALQFLPYLVLGGVLILGAEQFAGLLSLVVPPDLLELYGLLLAIEGTSRAIRDQTLGALLKQDAVQFTQLLRIFLLIAVASACLAYGREIDARTIAYAELAASGLSTAVAVLVLRRFLDKQPRQPGEMRTLRPWINHDALRFALNVYGSYLLTNLMSYELVTAMVARYLVVDATAQFGFVSRVLGQIRRVLPLDLFWQVIRPAVISRYESSGRRFDVLARDLSFILRGNLIVLGAILALLAGMGDAFVNAATATRISLPPLLLTALLATIVGHTIRRVCELQAFVVGQSRLFLLAALGRIAVPGVLTVALPPTGSLYSVALAFAVAELLFVGTVVRGLVRAGLAFSLPTGFWLRVGVAVVVSAAASRALATFDTTLVWLSLAAVGGGIAYLCTLPPLGLLTREDIARTMRAVSARRA